MGIKVRVQPFFRALRADLRKALLGRWFAAALLATLFSLWAGIARELRYLPDDLLCGDEPSWARLLNQAMQTGFAQLSLPALAALPAAGLALLELQTGAVRGAISRVGFRPYCAGKVVSALAGGMALEAAGLLLLLGLMHAIRLGALGAPIPFWALRDAGGALLARILCGGLWSGAGSLLALLTGTPSAATVGPLCLCYGLLMVGTRFFPDAAWINPLIWLEGAFRPLLAALCLVIPLLWAVMGRKAFQHV